MADAEQQHGGPSISRRKKNAGKLKVPAANDWSRTGEPRSRASPRQQRHGDIDIDHVESSDDDASDDKPSPRKPRRRLRPQLRPKTPDYSASDSADSEIATPAKAPLRAMKARSKSRTRVPNGTVPAVDTTPAHRRPTYIHEKNGDDYDDDDDDDDNGPPPSGPSRPVSRQTIARRAPSVRSTHRYRSTPESRRSPRTSVSDSEDDTGVTTDSASEEVIIHNPKHLPPAPMVPSVPSVPPANGMHETLQERLSRRPEMVYEETDADGLSRYAPSARHRSLSRPASSRNDRYRRPRDVTISGPPSLDERRRSRSRSKR